jgi:2-keto-4-pentenoate hydratase
MGLHLEIANNLHKARLDKQPLKDIGLPAKFSLKDGYSIQKQLISLNRTEGQFISGWKIAMANQAALDRFNIDEPIYGALFSDMLIEKDSLSSDRVIAPKLEAELTFIIGRNLESKNLSNQNIIDAITYIAPAFEIADCRYQDWKFNISSFVADNAAASFYKLGQKQVFKAGLTETNINCSLSYGGEILEGLAVKVLELHGRVESGQHFISGSLTRPIDMVPGNQYKLDMLGTSLILNYK